MSNTLSKLMEANSQFGHSQLVDIGKQLGRLYTDHGLPADMALDRLQGYSELQKVSIVDGICQWLNEHKRLSDASENALERQRKANRNMLERFVSTGETGAY